MNHLPKEALATIVDLLTTHSIDAEAANIIVNALKTSHRNFSRAKNKEEYSIGDEVVIEVSQDETYDGVIHKIGPKNIHVTLQDGRTIPVNTAVHKVRKRGC